MRKVVLVMSFLLFALFLIGAGNQAYSQELTSVKGYINDNPMDVDLLLDAIVGRTLAPLRCVSEQLGAEVSWNSINRSVEISRNGQIISLMQDSNIVHVNGEEGYIDMPARLVGNIMYIPLRFISEVLGEGVYWDGTVRIVAIPQIIKDGLQRGLTIFTNTFDNKQWVFEKNGSLSKIYPVATGKYSYNSPNGGYDTLTPKGEFTITYKTVNPIYFRKGIPGGDIRNPLGVRWMTTDYDNPKYRDDYGIHGTNVPNSIGTNASGGCTRMYNPDVIELYARTPSGTRGMVF